MAMSEDPQGTQRLPPRTASGQRLVLGLKETIWKNVKSERVQPGHWVTAGHGEGRKKGGGEGGDKLTPADQGEQAGTARPVIQAPRVSPLALVLRLTWGCQEDPWTRMKMYCQVNLSAHLPSSPSPDRAWPCPPPPPPSCSRGEVGIWPNRGQWSQVLGSILEQQKQMPCHQ